MDVKSNWGSPYHLEDHRQSAVALTNLDFAEYVALISDKIEQGQSILSRVQRECQKVGLTPNAKKINYITYNKDLKGLL